MVDLCHAKRGKHPDGASGRYQGHKSCHSESKRYKNHQSYHDEESQYNDRQAKNYQGQDNRRQEKSHRR